MIRVLIGTEKIEITKKHRILGLTFNEKPNWKEHIKDGKAMATKKLNLLKSLSHTSWDSDQKTLLWIHQMIVSSTLRYGKEFYGCAVLRQLDSIHHKSGRQALGSFVFCRTVNLLCEAGLAKLDEIRKLNNTKSAIRILTNADPPISPYFMNPKKLNKYVIWPRNPQLLFIRTADYLDETQIDIRRIEMVSRYDRPP
jgi:Fic family protein